MAFPLAVLLLYLAVLAVAMGRHADPSVFIVAGDKFVTKSELPVPIIVKPRSDGYDGQFYFRMALDPFNTAAQAHGVRIDWPAWRFQRIFYPLLSWAVSFGQARLVPTALVLVNLAGMAAIAGIAMRLRQCLDLAGWVPLAIVAWPGFTIALTHDTTEIISAALLLGAVLAYVSGRMAAYAALAACAALTRETNILVLAGIAGVEAAGTLIAHNRRLWVRRVLPCLLPLLPFFAWRQAVIWLCGQAPQAHGVAQNITWPFTGVVHMLILCVTGGRHWAQGQGLDLMERGLVLLSVSALLVLCGFAVARLPRMLSLSAGPGLAAGFALLLLLMSLLSATGPWIAPTAYFRALTECYILGCIVLGTDKTHWRRSRALGAAGCGIVLTVLFLCRLQLH